MSRALFIFNEETKKFDEVTPDAWKPRNRAVAKNYLTSDTMDPTQSMVTGKYHTSKSALRREYKDHGKVEIGNDVFTKRESRKEMPDAEPTIREAIRQVKWGEAPLTEYDKERCKIINRNLKNNCNIG